MSRHTRVQTISALAPLHITLAGWPAPRRGDTQVSRKPPMRGRRRLLALPRHRPVPAWRDSARGAPEPRGRDRPHRSGRPTSMSTAAPSVLVSDCIALGTTPPASVFTPPAHPQVVSPQLPRWYRHAPNPRRIVQRATTAKNAARNMNETCPRAARSATRTYRFPRPLFTP
jgi:hypothetical protein